MPKKAELTGAEWEVIKEVWRLEPCTATAVQEALDKARGWSYSTVRTLMDRMTAKGFLTVEKVRNQSLFRSAIAQEDAQRNEVLSILKTAFNGALAPFVQCLLDTRNLTEKELSDLEKLIKERKRSKN